MQSGQPKKATKRESRDRAEQPAEGPDVSSDRPVRSTVRSPRRAGRRHRIGTIGFGTLVLAACSLVSGSGIIAGEGDPAAPVESSYLDLIGIGWSDEPEGGARIVWRQHWPGIEVSESIRIFKHLEGRDVSECLAAIIDSSPELRSDLAKMGTGTACGGTQESIGRARELWTSYGFADALAEVAQEGRRGEAVARFLARCAALRDGHEERPEAKPTP